METHGLSWLNPCGSQVRCRLVTMVYGSYRASRCTRNRFLKRSLRAIRLGVDIYAAVYQMYCPELMNSKRIYDTSFTSTPVQCITLHLYIQLYKYCTMTCSNRTAVLVARGRYYM
jgi:hypothetical protein